MKKAACFILVILVVDTCSPVDTAKDKERDEIALLNWKRLSTERLVAVILMKMYQLIL